MSKITPLRIAIFPPLCWLALVLLWIVLPSPAVPWNDDPSEHLWRGKTLTRVYNTRDFFARNNDRAWNSEHESQRDAFALVYHYDRRTGDLVVGDPQWLHHRVHPSDAIAADAALSSSTAPTLSAPFAVLVRTGDHDGVNLPWFTRADATLLFWEIHRDSVAVPLRLRVAGPGVLEIWPDLPRWHAPEDVNDAAFEPDPTDIPHRGSYGPGEALLTISIQPPSATGPGCDASMCFRVTLPTQRASSSPSLTFGLRRVISSVMVPVGLLFTRVFEYLGSAVSVVLVALILLFRIVFFYAMAVLACWCRYRFPPFWAWAETFWMTRAVVPYVRRASTAEDGEKAESGIGVPPGPRPLTSVRGFFTSPSPLDDLLVTFEATMPLVQPLAISFRRRVRSGDEEGRLGADETPASGQAMAGEKAFKTTSEETSCSDDLDSQTR